MDKVVLDTNCLLMAISSRSKYKTIWESFLNGGYILCLTNDIIEEYVEVISRNINERLAAAVIYAILSSENIIKVDPHYRFNLIEADTDDNKFVDCAIVTNAKFIVSEDRHFDVLSSIPFPKIDVIGSDMFLNLCETSSLS